MSSTARSRRDVMHLGRAKSSTPSRASGTGASRPRVASRTGIATQRVPRVSSAMVIKVAASIALASLAILVGLLSGVVKQPALAPVIGAQLVYTAPTGNDAAVTIPDSVRASLVRIGNRHEEVSVTRIEANGTAQTGILDLTPRVGDQPDSEVLKVPDRVSKAIDSKISNLETEINDQTAAAGGRSLYDGLLRTNFVKGVPIYVVSSGLDLSDPVDFRKLGFDVAPSQVLVRLKNARELPDLGGSHVTFVLVPTTGSQEQMRRLQKDYVKGMWTALLMAGGAASVDFIDAVGGPSTSNVDTPPVSLPALPGTPITPIQNPDNPSDSVCRLSSATYFVPDTARLVDKAATESDLKYCVAHVDPTTTVSLDGWTAYDGPVDAGGRPTSNPVFSIQLSKERVRAIAALLVEMGISRNQIARMTGHGNDKQPYPQDPGSAMNRTVVIHFTTK